MLYDIVAEAVGEDLAWQRGNRDPRALPFQYVPEVFKVGVAPAYGAVLELEGGDVGAADDLVVGVHGTRGAVGLGISDL